MPVIRAEFLKLRNLDFVHAAVASGLSRRSIVFRHMLPNGVSPVLVNASFGEVRLVLRCAALHRGSDTVVKAIEAARHGCANFYDT